jgi:AraC-like DNA-binding protein
MHPRAIAESISSDLTATITPRGFSIGQTMHGESRTPLLQLSVGLVEDLRRNSHERSAEDFCERFQVCFPYGGLAVWHVGGDDVVADANQVLFVRGGEGSRLSGPIPGGYSELIVTPNVEILAEIVRANGTGLSGHPIFRRRYRRATPFLQKFRTRFLYWAMAGSDGDDLEGEEIVIALLRSAVPAGGDPDRRSSASTLRLIRRTKEFLGAQLANPIRLVDVGRSVGASPAYLTDVFTRVEGLSLHQYLTHLRLGRALVELPHADCLTTLALEIGFSSHSHFSAAFRRAFGCTPSTFRETARRAERPLASGYWRQRQQRVSA